MTIQEILKNCKIDKNIVRLPDIQLEREQYLEVKKKLGFIGGKWKGGKTQGFIFPNDPSELLKQISNGEKRNLKKEYQFFATPDELADKLVKLADISEYHTVLEPSAGQGSLINAVRRNSSNLKTIDCYELMDINRGFLYKLPNVNVLGADFFERDKTTQYDRIIANPPFTKNQDISHIKEMYSTLESYGKLVSLASKHWEVCDNKIESEFRTFLDETNADVIDVPRESFKESGTTIGANIIIINKN